MKKLIFAFIASISLVSVNAHAFDFGEFVEEVGKAQTTAESNGSSGIALDKIAEKEIQKITKQIEESIQKQLDQYKNLADKEIGKIEDLVKSELGNIETMIKDVTMQVKFFQDIKAKITGYIRLAITIATILVSGLIFLILMVFVLWFRVNRLAKKV